MTKKVIYEYGGGFSNFYHVHTIQNAHFIHNFRVYKMKIHSWYKIDWTLIIQCGLCAWIGTLELPVWIFKCHITTRNKYISVAVNEKYSFQQKNKIRNYLVSLWLLSVVRISTPESSRLNWWYRFRRSTRSWRNRSSYSFATSAKVVANIPTGSATSYTDS